MSTTSRQSMKSKMALIFVAATVAASAALPAQAQRHISGWDCYLNHQERQKVGSVRIWWGHTAGDAAWACNNWRPACSNNGGCYAEPQR